MASVRFEEALRESMTALKLAGLVLKEEQQTALYAVTSKMQDCLCILPTGFGKSLIFQLVPFIVDRLGKNIGTQSVQELFFLIEAFVKLFAGMIWLNVQYDLHTMLHR